VNRIDPKDIFIISALTMVSSVITVAALTPWWYTYFGGYLRQGCV